MVPFASGITCDRIVRMPLCYLVIYVYETWGRTEPGPSVTTSQRCPVLQLVAQRQSTGNGPVFARPSDVQTLSARPTSLSGTRATIFASCNWAILFLRGPVRQAARQCVRRWCNRCRPWSMTAKLAERGQAPVSGAAEHVAKGELTVLIGGLADAVDRVKPVSGRLGQSNCRYRRSGQCVERQAAQQHAVRCEFATGGDRDSSW